MPIGALCSLSRLALFFACVPVLVGGCWDWESCRLAGSKVPSYASRRWHGRWLVERVSPPDILLVPYLDDFLLVHHDKGYLRDNTGNTVIALGREGFIVSPKSVLEPATQLVFLGKRLDLLERMVWSHEVAHLQIFWHGFGWRCGGRKRRLCSYFWVSFIGRFDREAWHALLRRGLIVGLMRSGLGIPLWLS